MLGQGQMAQLLHPQDSGFYGRKEMSGGRWSFLELFGLRRHLRSTKKMLSDKKHGSRLRGCYVPFKDDDSGVTDEQSGVAAEQRSVTDEHKNTKVKNKQKGSKKSSGKSGLKSLFSRKLYGKEDQKEKMLPVGPKLLRTLSIHYLENNDYVLDGQSAANGDGSSHGAKLSLQNGTSANLQQDTFSNLDGSGTDTGVSGLSTRGGDHVKRKSHRSISMDGILHKVPYGQRVSGDNIRQELPRSASATYDRDGLKPYIGTAAKRHGNRGFRRSRSLSESLESYSHLLDSISSSESKRVLTSSKSTRDHSLDGPGAATALQRTSNSQLRSKSVVRLAEFLVIPEDTLASEVPEEIVGDVKLAVGERSSDEVAGGSENPVSLEELLSDKKCDVVESSTEADLCIAPLASEVVDVSEEEAATCDGDQVLSSTEVKLCSDPSASEVDIPEEHATTCDDDDDDDLVHSSTGADPCTLLSLLQSEDIDIAEQHVTPSDDQIQSCTTAQPSEDIVIAEEHAIVSEDNQIRPFDALKSVKGTCCVPDPNKDTEDELNLCCEQETESPTSVLDVAFSDHPAASSENHTMLDDSSLVEKTVHPNEAHDHSVGNDHGLDASTSVRPPSSSSIQENMLQENNLSDLNALQEAADHPKNEAELAYVKDIFNKSSFRDEALFDGWCSQNRAALQEDDCQHYDAAAAAIDFTDMSADELLLFDLTNEALLDVYKDYAAGMSRQPRFSSFQRPKPVGDRALRELRSKVSCRLDERPQSSVEVDAVLSSDLAKAERWNNFRREADQVANQVAHSVLDKLVTELALQLGNF